MAYYLGTDEAGYGPNLGPLTISATVWHVAELLEELDLYDLLASVVAAVWSRDETRLVFADSKKLYRPKQGLRLLEQNLLPALAVGQRSVPSWQSLWEALGADPQGDRHRLPWYAQYNVELPLAISASEVASQARTFEKGLDNAKVRLHAIASRAVFPPSFNQQIAQYGTKSTLLTRTTLDLVADMLRPLGDEPVRILCDKHGARNCYQGFLQEAFPEWLVEVCLESRPESIYRWGPPERRIEIRFRARGEGFLPAALASMTSKYLREMAMRAFNDFWCGQVQGLAPTAGYPVDAKRFKSEIASRQQQLGIEDQRLWRAK